jgi:serine/threonine-protein kinase
MAEAGQSVTQTGSMMGTPTYMSPEQLTDTKRVDRRTDIYAMGATLFELLTAQRSVPGETLPEVISNVLQGNVQRTPSAKRGQLPAWLDSVVQRALAADPVDRFATAAAMKQAIEAGREAGPMVDSAGAGVAVTVLPDAVAATVPPTIAPRPEVTPKPAASQPPAAVAAAPTVEAVARGTRTTKPAILGGLVAVTAGVVAVVVLTRKGDAPAVHTPPPAADAAIAVVPDAHVIAPPPTGMVRIAGATFELGSTQDEVDDGLAWCQRLAGQPCPRELYERELPRHPVTLGAFDVDRTEVTNAEFAAALTSEHAELRDGRFVQLDTIRIADLHAAHAGIRRSGSGFVAVDGIADLPVVQVTWEGADWYCRFLGKRLLGEAEWELASRGTARRPFPWGSDRDVTCEQVIHGRGAGQPCAGAGDRPAVVGTAARDVTPEGIHDLGGNVAEWVSDPFAPYDPACTGSCLVTAEAGADVRRVARGGYFDGLAESLRAAGRSRFDHGAVNLNVGLRCAKAVQ